MSEHISFSKARLRPWRFAINQKQTKKFILKVNGEDPSSVSGWTWELVVKKNKGAIPVILKLTLGNGLAYETYSTYTLVATFEAAQTNIPEGPYFCYLRRTDIPEVYIWGPAQFSFGDFDSEL